uniref:(northern house mosquito) hypothetical protein n=1 Tax=Culex pipiens TaxID=7175 RepID=A0A8D8JCS1_CULPI
MRNTIVHHDIEPVVLAAHVDDQRQGISDAYRSRHPGPIRPVSVSDFHVALGRTQRKHYGISRCDLNVEKRKCYGFPKVIPILASHLEVLIKLFLDQWVVLHCHRVPHKVFRWVLPAVVAVGILPQCSAAVQLDQELVVVPARTVDVHAVRIVRVTRRIQQSTERSIEPNTNLHIVILAFRFNMLHPGVVEPVPPVVVPVPGIGTPSRVGLLLVGRWQPGVGRRLQRSQRDVTGGVRHVDDRLAAFMGERFARIVGTVDWLADDNALLSRASPFPLHFRRNRRRDRPAAGRGQCRGRDGCRQAVVRRLEQHGNDGGPRAGWILCRVR